MTARMLGRVHPAQCPVCRTPPGPDCPTAGRDKRQQRRAERRELRTIIRKEADR